MEMHLIELWHILRWKDPEQRRYPDGRGYIYQPKRFVRAMEVIGAYYAANGE
jgi:hypothetical protein